MSINVGTLDRVARLVLAALLAYLALFTAALGTELLMWLALAVALVFAGTAIASRCPLYAMLGLKSCTDC